MPVKRLFDAWKIGGSKKVQVNEKGIQIMDINSITETFFQREFVFIVLIKRRLKTPIGL